MACRRIDGWPGSADHFITFGWHIEGMARDIKTYVMVAALTHELDFPMTLAGAFA
jgi:hypothetical protein